MHINCRTPDDAFDGDRWLCPDCGEWWRAREKRTPYGNEIDWRRED